MSTHLTRAGFEDRTYCTDEPVKPPDTLTTNPDLPDCPACIQIWTSWTKHLKHADRRAGLQSWP